MVRQDVVTAIVNAVERGASLEKARQILINSGYSISDVNEAAGFLSGSMPQQSPQQYYQSQNQISQSPQSQNSIPQQFPSQQQSQQQNSSQITPSTKKKFPILTILLAGVLIFLVLILVFTFVFKSQVIGFLQGLLG